MKGAAQVNLYDNPDFFAAYSQMARSQGGLPAAGEWHQLKNLLPPMDGKAMLDLGCGYGWHCRYAAEQGASTVLGIDSSEKMLQKAREINAHPQIVYQQCDLTQFAYPVNQYDVVMSNLVLHYVENLAEIYANVHRMLRRGGCFALNIEHPTFTAGVNQEWVNDANGKPLYWPVDDYFTPARGRRTFWGTPSASIITR